MPPSSDSPEIITHSDHWVAVHKPSGWLVHRTAIAAEAQQFLLQWVRAACGQSVFPVHRLDRPASGIVLFALDGDYARHLGKAFATEQVDKHYVALVRGWPESALTIDHPLARTRDDCAPGKSPQDYPKAAARSSMVPHARYEVPLPNDRHPTTRIAMVGLQPHTGRRHQLRRHMKHISHPLIGDPYYGKGPLNRAMAERYGCHRLMLACVEMRWDSHRVVAPIAHDFQAALARIDHDAVVPSTQQAFQRSRLQ
jgi:tRNA pseudouridine65 synthase